MNKAKVTPFVVVGFLYLIGIVSPLASAQETKKPFTVADEIGLAHFGEVRFSPDVRYVAVYASRGQLDLNRVEDSLRFYRSRDLENFLERPEESQPPSPVWVVNRSAKNESSGISDWRWLSNSSGVAFLERTAGGNNRLVFADLQKKTVEPLTSATEAVNAFDIRDRRHYVYTVFDPGEREKGHAEHQAPTIVATTAHSLYEFLFPDDPRLSSPRSYLRAVVGGKRFEVKANGAPLVPEGAFALSPDGRSLITTLTVPEVPSSWETLYPPPYASSAYHIRVPRQDVQSGSVHQYVLVDLQTASIKPLTDAPTSNDAGWWVDGSPSWSRDGQDILLPGTFIRSKELGPSRPCVALVDLPSNTETCVEILKGHTETGVEEDYHLIKGACFMNGGKQRVKVIFRSRQDSSLGTTEYQRMADGRWQVAGQSKGMREFGHNDLEVTVKEGLDDPPQLIATKKQVSRIIWDPNPQLKNIELGHVSVYAWKDKEGREWKGGLYKPSNYTPGQRYPLVIQTHGFAEFEFRPSGGMTTAFAARALAVAGIIVLQVGYVGECSPGTPDEGPCNAFGYEVVANKLVSEGMVDPEKIGIIGFSRTCFYVMEMLTTNSLHLKAASITDGVMFTYLQYMAMVDGFAHEADPIIGAKPFADGLQQWLKRSPGFKLDKVTTPLLVVAEGPADMLFMWEPYAGLRHLQKPVDLIMLNTNEHVLTNPAMRMASQGGSVDWFRFWLQDYEDPDPAKAEQYARWHELRKLQEENDAKDKAAKEKPAPVN